jgi:L-2-hydroxyglutarate oxidase
LIYPVPNPNFPFLGVHFTRRIHGGVEAGPNAVLALRREGYSKKDFSLTDTIGTLGYRGFWRMAAKYWVEGAKEMYRSFSKRAFLRALQRLMPELQESDLRPGGSGVRAQALDRNGRLLDDFQIVRTGTMIHVLNVPSPAATASLVIGRKIADMLAEQMNANCNR